MCTFSRAFYSYEYVHTLRTTWQVDDDAICFTHGSVILNDKQMCYSVNRLRTYAVLMPPYNTPYRTNCEGGIYKVLMGTPVDPSTSIFRFNEFSLVL